jgi:hypothetical protein
MEADLSTDGVSPDLLQDFEGHAQGPTTISSGDDWGRSSADRRQKRFEFDREGFTTRHLEPPSDQVGEGGWIVRWDQLADGDLLFSIV